MGEIGIALLISAILGATIDRWMKAEIASDVFRASLGFILPEEFHQEIRKIVQFTFLCEVHQMWYDIKMNNDESVSVTIKLERKLRNIANKPQKYKNYTSIDEWGFSKESHIRRCSIISSKGHITEFKEARPRVGRPSLVAETEEITVAPNDTFTLVSEFTETRRNNDQITSVFLSPTKNPHIHVNCPGFDYLIDFGVLEQRVGKSPISETHTLDGVYFPPGQIRLRWWLKDNSHQLSS